MMQGNIEAVAAILMTDAWPELCNKVNPLEVLPSGDCEDSEKVEGFATREAGDDPTRCPFELGLTKQLQKDGHLLTH